MATSQKKPNAAMPSEPSVTSTGSAAQPGTGTTRSASAASRVEHGHPAAPVAGRDRERDGGEQPGDDRRRDQVLHGGAAGGLACCDGCERREVMVTVSRLLAVGYPG